MPTSYQIFPKQRIKLIKISGKTNLRELKAAAERYFDDPEFSIENRFLVDLTYLVDVDAGFRDAMSLYSFYQNKLTPFGKTIDVVIAAPSDISFGMTKMFAALASEGNVMKLKICPTYQDACNQLDFSEALEKS